MICATPVRDTQERDDLLESVGIIPGEHELLICVSEDETLYAFCLMQFVKDYGRITRIIRFPGATSYAIDLGLRAALNLFDRARVSKVYYAPACAELAAAAKAIGFYEEAKNDLCIELAKFFGKKCSGASINGNE